MRIWAATRRGVDAETRAACEGFRGDGGDGGADTEEGVLDECVLMSAGVNSKSHKGT